MSLSQTTTCSTTFLAKSANPYSFSSHQNDSIKSLERTNLRVCFTQSEASLRACSTTLYSSLSSKKDGQECLLMPLKSLSLHRYKASKPRLLKSRASLPSAEKSNSQIRRRIMTRLRSPRTTCLYLARKHWPLTPIDLLLMTILSKLSRHPNLKI